MIDQDKYDYPSKRHHRRWLRKNIMERSDKHQKDMIGLYLIGSEKDYEREEFIKAGFNNNNLIGIDKNEEFVKAVKKNGNYALMGDIGEIIINWGKKDSIDFLSLDFISGYTNYVQDLIFYLLPLVGHQSLSDPLVILINLKRGREKETSDLKNIISKIINTPCLDEITQKIYKNIPGKNKQLHRGMFVYWDIFRLMWNDHMRFPNTKNIWNNLNDNDKLMWFKNFFEVWWKITKPIFYTYKTKTKKANNLMDSVIFRLTLNGTKRDEKNNWLMNGIIEEKNNMNLKRQIAALKAIRTMKIGNRLIEKETVENVLNGKCKCVYFLQDKATKYIKIGKTYYLPKRFREHSQENRTQLELIAIMPGEYDKELQIHEQFKQIKALREWFLPTQELIQYIYDNTKVLKDPYSLSKKQNQLINEYQMEMFN